MAVPGLRKWRATESVGICMLTAFAVLQRTVAEKQGPTLYAGGRHRWSSTLPGFNKPVRSVWSVTIARTGVCTSSPEIVQRQVQVLLSLTESNYALLL